MLDDLRKSKAVPKVSEGDVDKDESKKESADTEGAPKKSNWLEKIRQEQAEREARLQKEKEERASRIRALLDSDSEKEEEIDYKELVGDKLTDFLSKIENHVMAE